MAEKKSVPDDYQVNKDFFCLFAVVCICSMVGAIAVALFIWSSDIPDMITRLTNHQQNFVVVFRLSGVVLFVAGCLIFKAYFVNHNSQSTKKS